MNPLSSNLILGEYRRTLDERHRVSIPPEMWLGAAADTGSSGEKPAAAAAKESGSAKDEASGSDCVLAKERPGCLSLWQPQTWQGHHEAGMRVIESKLLAGRLGDRMAQVQTLGRLLSTRHRNVKLAGRGRLAIPEGFREFLGVEPNGELLVVGAAVCVELWHPDAWRACLHDQIPQFGQLLDELSS